MNIDSKVLDWVLDGGVGLSSKCMAAHLTGRPCDGSYPHDRDDLGRCIKLLEAIPELRDRLPKMSEVGRAWAAYVEHWDELEALYRQEGRGCTERMRQIVKSIEASDPNVHRFGSGAKIVTGRPA